MTRHQYATFVVDDLLFGVEATAVQEVLRAQETTPVPLAPAVVAGLLNLRGEIVTAVDLRRRLGLPPRADGRPPMNVVLCRADGAVSLLVDGIGDVVDVDADAVEARPETVRGPARDLVTGACQLHDRLLLLLDADRAVAVVPSP